MPNQSISLTNLSRLMYLSAFGVYSASLFLPAFITENTDIYGYWVLALGWLGFVSFQFAWYAAPLAVLVVYHSKNSPQLALLLAVVTIVLASEAFLFSEVPFDQGDKVIDYGLGFYVWYSAFFLVAFGALIRLVAWGNVREDAETHSAQTGAVEPDAANKPHWSAPRAQRKVVPVGPASGALESPAQIANPWKKAVPPPLPKRDIYAQPPERREPAARNKRVIKPPPLPQNLHQPPRPPATPPPLPVKSKQ